MMIRLTDSNNVEVLVALQHITLIEYSQEEGYNSIVRLSGAQYATLFVKETPEVIEGMIQSASHTGSYTRPI